MGGRNVRDTIRPPRSPRRRIQLIDAAPSVVVAVAVTVAGLIVTVVALTIAAVV